MKINFLPISKTFAKVNTKSLNTGKNVALNFYASLKPMPVDSVSFTHNKEIKDNKKSVVILIGPPNGGKGTSSSYITEKYNIPVIGMGNILRNEVKKGSELGKLAQPYLEAGTMIPDDITFDIFKTRISEDDCKNGYILDGFPRTKALAEMLQTYFDEKDDIKLNVIELDVDENVLYDRCEKRYVCSECNKVHSVDKNEYDGEVPLCTCGGTLIKRDDDTVEKLQKRINYYKTTTMPVIDFYKDKGVLNKIEIKTTSYPISEMTDNIDKILETEEDN